MPTQAQPPRPLTSDLGQHVARFYCRTSRRLFGKTLSLMAGEAHAMGRWYGGPCTWFINRLLRDPMHCENELRGAKYEWLRAS